MKAAFTTFLLALIVVGAVRAADAKADAVLFAHSDYRFVVTSWTAEPTEKEKKRRVSLTISYDVPKGARFILYISQSPGGTIVDSIAFRELKSTPKGEEKLEFESDAEPTSFFVGLWKGVGVGSPSGITCDGAIVSFPLKITPVFRHE